MKRIEEFTHEEMVAMDDAAIQRQVMIECAMDGVQILPPPKPYEKPTVERRGQYFELTGSDLKAKSEEPLRRIAEAIIKEREHLVKTTYEYKYGYDSHYVEGNNAADFMIERRPCFLLEDLVANADKIAKAKEVEEENRKYKTDFDKENAKVITIRENIMSAVYKAKRRQNRADWLKDQHKQYLDLADGNRQMADGFFWKAYGANEDNALLSEIAPREYEAQA